MSFMQRLAQRPIFTSPGMNRTNQEPREGPRSRRATSPVVTENRRRWLSPRLPGQSVANRPRGVAEGEATGARGHPATLGLLWWQSAGVQSSLCPRRSGGVEPPPGARLRPRFSTHGVQRPCVWQFLRPQPCPCAALAHWPEEATPTLGERACLIGPRLEAGLESDGLTPEGRPGSSSC